MDRFGVQEDSGIAPHQLRDHGAMVILDTITLTGMNDPLQTARATTPERRMGFMPVQNRDHEPMGWRIQSLHPLQT